MLISKLSGSSPLTRGKPFNGHERAARVGLIPAHAGKTSLDDHATATPQAHPRSRGENPRPRLRRERARGSSPLTRGKRHEGEPERRGLRLIPAHAGKTRLATKRARCSTAHPRSRGENMRWPFYWLFVRGSSPLTRGKHVTGKGGKTRYGLIPAHAGKTASDASLVTVTRAHPRSRGENPLSARGRAGSPGSSPLTRGKRPPAGWSHSCPGLIPAHAGKTGRTSSSRCGRAAHPRSRGENAPVGGDRDTDAGSSPLTRGKRAIRRSVRIVGGLIPAHAGKTRRSRRRSRRRRAHPRSRGENVESEQRSPGLDGSSPLTRGKHELDVGHARRWGLIPAHAGKTTSSRCTEPGLLAHPRSRGENAASDAMQFDLEGSSPLTRGKPRCPPTAGSARRLIPAHAGKTHSGAACRGTRAAHPRSRGENT